MMAGLLPLAAFAGAPPRVVVSIAPLHSLAAQVMKGAGEPALLIDTAASPHSVALKPSQVRALARADLVVWVGGALESSLQNAIAALSARQRVLTLIETPALHRLAIRRRADAPSRSAGPGDAVDPHLWLDPDNARRIVRLIAARLQTLDPARADLYAHNAAQAEARLRTLTHTVEARLQPLRDAPFIVFHDAYQYLEYRYHLKNVGIIRSHPEQGPSARHLQHVARDVKATGIVCVFAEPQFAAAAPAFISPSAPVIRLLDPLGQGLPEGPDLYHKMMTRLVNILSDCLIRNP